MSKLVENSVIYAIGGILTKALAFFLIPLYTKYFSVEEYGMLSLLNLLLNLMTFVFLLGLSNAAERFYFDRGVDDNYRRQLYGNVTLLLFLLVITLTIAAEVFFYFFSKNLIPSVPFFPYIFLMLLLVFFNPLIQLMTGLLRVQRKAKSYITFYLSFFIVQAIFIIFAIGYLKTGLEGQLCARLVTFLIFWAISIVVLLKYSRFAFSWQLTKKLFLFGIPLVPYFIFGWLIAASGRFMLERYAGLEEVGLFALAAQFSLLILLLSSALGHSFVPHFYETAGKPDGPEILGDLYVKIVAFFGLVVLFVLAAARPTMLIMANPKFYGAIDYVPLLLLANWLFAIYGIFGWSLMFAKRTDVSATITGVMAILTIGLLFIFLKQWRMGINGVLYSMILVGIVRIIVGYLVSERHYKIKHNFKGLAQTISLLLIGSSLIVLVRIDNLVISTILKLLIFCGAFIVTIKVARIESFKKLFFIGVRAGNLN